MPVSIHAHDEMAQDVMQIYEEAELDVLRAVARQLEKGVTDPSTWAIRKSMELRGINDRLTKIVANLSRNRKRITNELVKKAYQDASGRWVVEAREYLDVMGAEPIKNMNKVALIVDDLNRTMDAADRTILRQCNDVYADIVGHVTAKAATGAITYKEAVRQELEDFANRGVTSFVDRAGRRWEMSSYAEMATLTGIEKATLQGYVDTMREYGYDLAVISSHAGACPICTAWEDVVVSVSGEDRHYPSLAEAQGAGVFHPRCMHDLNTYYPGISHTQALKRPAKVEKPSAEYTERSQLRNCERNIRKWKRRMAVASDRASEQFAWSNVRKWQGEARNIVKTNKHGILRQYGREGGRQKLRFK